MTQKHYLSIDIGGTYIKYGILDHSGQLISKNKKRTSTNLDYFLIDISDIIEQSGLISGIGISTPGKVDTEAGIIYGGGNLTFLDGCPIVSILRQKYDLPVDVQNDRKAAALAESLGHLQGIEDGAAIILGTGIGGGISSRQIVIEGIQHAFHNLRMREDLVKKSIHNPIIESTKFNNDANLYGTLYNLLLNEKYLQLVKNSGEKVV